MATILARRLLASTQLSNLAGKVGRTFSSSPSVLAPQVQHPAPAFKTQAVVDGAFKEIALEVDHSTLSSLTC